MTKGREDRGSPRLQPTHLELQELRGPVVEANHPRRPEGRWRSGHGRLKWEGDKAGGEAFSLDTRQRCAPARASCSLPRVVLRGTVTQRGEYGGGAGLRRSGATSVPSFREPRSVSWKSNREGTGNVASSPAARTGRVAAHAILSALRGIDAGRQVLSHPARSAYGA